MTADGLTGYQLTYRKVIPVSMKQVVYKCFPPFCFSSRGDEILNNMISTDGLCLLHQILYTFFLSMSIIKGHNSAMLSSPIWCVLHSEPDIEKASKQITPLKLLRLLACLQEYKWTPPHSLDYAHHTHG